MIPLVNPSDSAALVLDWTDVCGALTLASVSHTAPAGLTKVGESTDAPNKLSQIIVSGATHAQIYQVTAVATLSDGQQITRVVPCRAMNS